MLWLKKKAVELLIAGALAIVAGLGGYLYGHGQGVASTDLKWTKAENKRLGELSSQLDEAKARLLEKEEQLRALEQESQKKLTDILNESQRKLKNVETERDGALLALRNGGLQLWDYGFKGTATPATGIPQLSEAAGGASGGSGGGAAHLSLPLSEYLVKEFAACDATAVKLGRAQTILRTYIDQCNKQ